MAKILLRFFRLIFGLLLYAVGIVLTIRANVGYGPWEVFHVGLGKTIGITIGTASILVGLVVIVITIILGEKIGIGTILNMILIGVFMDLILKMNIFTSIYNSYFGIVILVIGLFVISVGSFFYIGSGFGAGPRDGLMVALTRKTRLPIGVVRSLIELAATAIGWLLGGMVGVGTVVSVLAIGFCIQGTFRLFRFDAVTVEQATLMDTYEQIRELARSDIY